MGDSSKSNNAGKTIGITILVIILLLVIGGFVWYLLDPKFQCKYNKNKCILDKKCLPIPVNYKRGDNAVCVSTPPIPPQPTPLKYCYKNSSDPLRTLIYKDANDNCNNPQEGWNYTDPIVGSGGEIKGFGKKETGTEKYCYRYADNPNRTIFFKGDNCDLGLGWGYKDPKYGDGGSMYLYPTETKGATKYCYKNVDKPVRTIVYKSDDCGIFKSDFNDPNVGSGGQFWAVSGNKV